jgi:hypothetical protein
LTQCSCLCGWMGQKGLFHATFLWFHLLLVWYAYILSKTSCLHICCLLAVEAWSFSCRRPENFTEALARPPQTV